VACLLVLAHIAGILGSLAKLEKATISFVMSVCPSVCVVQLGSHLTDFHEILSIIRKSV